MIEVKDKAITEAEAGDANNLSTHKAHSFAEHLRQQQTQKSNNTNISSNETEIIQGEHHARNYQSTTGGTNSASDNNQAQKASTSKSDYLF